MSHEPKKILKHIDTHIGSRVMISTLQDGGGIVMLSASHAGFDFSQPLTVKEAKDLSIMLSTAIIKAEDPVKCNVSRSGISMEDL